MTLDTVQEKVKLAVHLAAEKKAIDPKVMEIGKVSIIADYFIVLSGLNQRHVQAVTDFIVDEFKKRGVPALRQEGYREGRWVLLDYGDLVIHIFLEEERNFYNLERLWGHAPKVDNIEKFI